MKAIERRQAELTKHAYKAVVFIENGKQAKTVKVAGKRREVGAAAKETL